MGAERRLFLAVGLDDGTRHALAGFLNGKRRLPGKLVPPENWHITVRFLGRSGLIRQEMLLAALESQLAMQPFRLSFGGLGAFPRPRRATVLWLGIESGVDALDELAATCEAAAQQVGFDPEERPFHPHLTLSRIRPQLDVSALVDEFPRFPGRLEVDSVVLYESITRSGGAVYEELERLPLRKA